MKYNCPVCGMELREQVGEPVHPGDAEYGITLDCSNPVCAAPEVMGHGDKAKDAFEVIQAKFKKTNVGKE